MLELNVEPGPFERFVFLEEPNITKGEKTSPLTLDAAVEIAGPGIRPLTEELIGDDKELKAFWEGERNRYSYSYLAFRCSFQPQESQPFVRAWFEVSLEGANGGESPQAWSMDPHEVVDVSKLTEKAQVGGEFKFLSGRLDYIVDTEQKEWFLHAYREGFPNPYWMFRRTSKSPIDGVFHLKLVVRSPINTITTGRISLRAVVENRTFWICRQEEEFKKPASKSFTLPAQP